MTRLLIVAHAPLASALQAVAAHAYPECASQVQAIDVPAEAQGDAVAAAVRTVLDAAPGDTLILTDVFGATPCNAALAAADGLRARVVAGVNVPMLWRTLCYREQSLDDLVGRAVAGAAQGAMHVAVPRRQNQSVSPLAHDHVQHHHQQ